MKTLIIYESMYGNTRDVANAIAEGFAEFGEVETVEVGHANDFVEVGVDLLVVGAPTHQFGLSRFSSRAQAARDARGQLVSSGIGVREWLDRVARPREGLSALAFDTLMAKPAFLKYMGRASRKIAKRLQRMNCTLVRPAESFWVESGTGPLAAGELERARDWARQTGAQIAERKAVPTPV
jgi:hypothetical protein